MSTCNWLDLQTVRSQPIMMPKNLPHHWGSSTISEMTREVWNVESRDVGRMLSLRSLKPKSLWSKWRLYCYGWPKCIIKSAKRIYPHTTNFVHENHIPSLLQANQNTYICTIPYLCNMARAGNGKKNHLIIEVSHFQSYDKLNSFVTMTRQALRENTHSMFCHMYNYTNILSNVFTNMWKSSYETCEQKKRDFNSFSTMCGWERLDQGWSQNLQK